MNEDKKYIYESPDKGNTVYRREMGSSNKEVVGTTLTITPVEHYEDYDTMTIDDHDWVVDTTTLTTDLDLDDLLITMDSITITDGSDYVGKTVDQRLDTIERRLSILEPKKELLDKYEVLQGLYEQYKAAEAMLDGPDPEETE